MEPIGIESGPLVTVAPLVPNETPSTFAVIVETGFVVLPAASVSENCVV